MQLNAVARDSAGIILAVSGLAWRSSRPDVAAVSATGLLTALAVGSTTVEVAAGALRSVVTITVYSPTSVSVVNDSLVVVTAPTLAEFWAPLNPSAYPNTRVQPSGYRPQAILDLLRPLVSSAQYDFILVYTADSVPGWINSGVNYGTGAQNIGNDSPRSPPSGWGNLRGAPSMNWIGFQTTSTFDQTTFLRTAIHEMGHHWGVFLPRGTGGPRAWRKGRPVAELAGGGGHWSWNWLPDSQHPGFSPPGMLYSGPLDNFNAFDLYIMGLMSYTEVRDHQYTVYEDSLALGRATGARYPVTIDSLVDALRKAGAAVGDGRRIPDVDPSARSLRTLVVYVTTPARGVSATARAALDVLVRRLPEQWRAATWGRSDMRVDVLRP